MRRSARLILLGLAVAVVVTAIGCQSPGLRFLNLIGIKENPLVIALVARRQAGPEAGPLAVLDPFAPYERMQAVVGAALGRPVGLDLYFPAQLEPALARGMCHLAVVSPIMFARLPQRERFEVLVVPADEAGRVARPALLIAARGAPIESVENLRGKSVAFGPADDSRTHAAALLLLADLGLQPKDLALELLPLPGSLKHVPDAQKLAQTVMDGTAAAGFLDEADWDALPDHAAQADEPARDQLRVIARTIALPNRLLLSSPTLDAATRAQLRDILLTMDRQHPDALRPLHISSCQIPSAKLLAACERLAEIEPGPEKPAP